MRRYKSWSCEDDNSDGGGNARNVGGDCGDDGGDSGGGNDDDGDGTGDDGEGGRVSGGTGSTGVDVGRASWVHVVLVVMLVELSEVHVVRAVMLVEPAGVHVILATISDGVPDPLGARSNHGGCTGEV